MRLKNVDIAKLLKGFELNLEIESNYIGVDDWELGEVLCYEDDKSKKLSAEDLGELVLEIIRESLADDEQLVDDLKTEYIESNRY